MATYLRKDGSGVSAADEDFVAGGDLVGFPPQRILVVNESNGASLEWFDAMGQGFALVRTAAGAQSVVTTGGVTTQDTGFTIAGSLEHFTDADGERLTFYCTG